MTTEATAPTTGPGLAPPSRSAMAAAWNRFWFTPADPTVLGVIRICCGLVVCYTFLAYTLDLQALLGEHAWLDLETRQLMYREAPTRAPAADWDTARGKGLQSVLGYTLAPLPATPEQLDYWEKYVKRWAAEPPGPYPRTDAEDDWIERYHLRWGVDPRTLDNRGRPHWSIWFHVTDPGAMMAVQLAIVVVSFLFLIGFCTRVTAVLTWLAALSYMHRASASLFGADTMMAILLLYLMIGPCGAVLSVDRLLSRWWASRGQGRADGVTAALPPVEPSVSANLAIRLLQIHLCIIYLSAGLAKLQGVTWWSGTAVWGTLANFEFAPMQDGWYSGVLRFLAGHRWLFEVTMTAAAYFTLFFELGYTYLVWRRSTRWLILGMAVTLHGFIGLFMGLKTFSLLMLTMNLAFVPPQTLRRFLARVSRGRFGGGEDGPAKRESRVVAVGQDSNPDRAMSGSES